jgi:heme oxygenase
MYVGMFAGGQIVRGWCKTALRLKNDDGTKALDFSATIPDVKEFRRGRYNDAFNSLQLTREERDSIIEQKRRIFELNNTIFAELRASAEYRSRIAFVLACMLGLAIVIWLMLR